MKKQLLFTFLMISLTMLAALSDEQKQLMKIFEEQYKQCMRQQDSNSASSAEQCVYDYTINLVKLGVLTPPDAETKKVEWLQEYKRCLFNCHQQQAAITNQADLNQIYREVIGSTGYCILDRADLTFAKLIEKSEQRQRLLQNIQAQLLACYRKNIIMNLIPSSQDDFSSCWNLYHKAMQELNGRQAHEGYGRQEGVSWLSPFWWWR